MHVYIPESELNNAEHMQKVIDIMEKVPDTDLHCIDDEEMTIDDAIRKIRELGEDKIADLIGGGYL